MTPVEERIERKLRLLHQCPGCWSYGTWTIPHGEWIECMCGEKMTLIDLRAPKEESCQ